MVSGSIPRIPACANPPMNPPPSENARVYPTSSQATVTRGMEMKLIMIMLSTPEVRTMPP